MNFHKIIIAFVLFSTIVGAEQAIAQNTFNTDFLQGAWIFDYNQSLTSADQESQAYYEKMKADVSRLARFEAANKDRKISFVDNNVYLQKRINGSVVSGTWSFIDASHIEVLSSKGSRIIFEIVYLTQNQLALKNTSATNNGNPVFSVRYFVKQ